MGRADAVEIDSEAVLNFWFNHTPPSQWFRKDPDFDALLRERFLGLTRQAIAGELGRWSETPQGRLALVLLLDQFPRQLWRESARACPSPAKAMALSEQALKWGWVEAEIGRASCRERV